MTDEWARRERAVAEGIAYIAWRWRNPAAGWFDPIGDDGHRALVDAAVEFIRDPAKVVPAQEKRHDRE